VDRESRTLTAAAGSFSDVFTKGDPVHIYVIGAAATLQNSLPKAGSSNVASSRSLIIVLPNALNYRNATIFEPEDEGIRIFTSTGRLVRNIPRAIAGEELNRHRMRLGNGVFVTKVKITAGGRK
jgi:hypothetical protein